MPETPTTSANPVDLTDLATAKYWIKVPSTSTDDDQNIQECITAWSFEFLRRTGRGDQGQNDTVSPFAEIVNYDEFYDGAGTNRLFLRNRPIVSVAAVLVNGLAITASAGYAVQGYVIDGSRKSIALRPGLLGWGNGMWQSWQAGAYHKFTGLRFYEGIQNIEVQYSAGYASTPEDIVQCALKVVAQNYKRRNSVDEASRAMSAGGGTVRYRDWDVPPETQYIIDRYTRTL